jgi:hypothetical protein
MPSATLTVRRAYAAAEETALLLAVHECIVEAFEVDPANRNLSLIVLPAQRFIGRPDVPDADRLTNVDVYVLPGRSVAAKRHLYRLLVERLGGFGIPPACILIRLHELPAQNFGVRGGQALCDVELGYPLNV